MDADFSEVMQLAADLESAPSGIAPKLAKALGVTANLVKQDARKSVRRRKGLGHAAHSINYDLVGVSGPVSSMSAEIGYDKNGAGHLGNLIEFGAPNAGNQLAPSHDLGNALLNNEDDFVRGVERAVADAMREVNL